MNTLNSSLSAAIAFDELKHRLDALRQHHECDNEATRHDRLVVPFLTHPALLGWEHTDLVAQPTIAVPTPVTQSLIFRHGAPKSRRPYILVTSADYFFNALVVEEKGRQHTLDRLNAHRCQLHEYQALYGCVWGLLTDGDKWILKKGFETFISFDSLDALHDGLQEIQHCIGKQHLLQRKLASGTCDPVIVVPAHSIPRLVQPPGNWLRSRTLRTPVISCQEAAIARGIPLDQELKTLILETSNGILAVHLPGDGQLSLREIKRQCNVEHAHLATPETLEHLGLSPGTVSAVLEPVWSMRQFVSPRVFDVAEIMTNNGTLTGYFSFSPSILAAAVNSRVVECETVNDAGTSAFDGERHAR